MKIEVHIDRLLLDEALLGVERASAVQQTIEGELGRLLATPDACDALRNIGHVASLPPMLLLPASHSRDRLGARIAGAVHSGLGKPSPSMPAAQESGAKR